MAAKSHPPLGDVSCRATGYAIQQLQRMKLPTAHVTRGLAYTLDGLQDQAASISWNDYLVFFRNSHCDLPTEKFVELCTSYQGSPYLRPLLSAAGLWFHPARYFERLADPESGAMRQLYPCLRTRFTQLSDLELVFEEVVEPGFAMPPDLFWEAHSIGLGALTTSFGLAPSIVNWEPIERGAAFRVRLPRRRPVRFVLSWLASWFRRDTADDVRNALSFGHERSLRLEREISERKVAETALRESEERFRRITEAVPGVVYQYYLDSDGGDGFAFISHGVTDLTGYTPEEVISQPDRIWGRITPDDILSVQQTIQESARNGTPWQHTFRFQTKTGDTRWVRARSIPEPITESGRILWNGILNDVTVEKQADLQLHARDALLQKLSEQVPGVIYQYQQWPDGRTCFPYASEGIRGIYEVTPDEVRASAATVFARLHPDDLNAVAESIRRSLETMEPWRYEYRVRLPERGTRWLDGHAVPERLPDGSTMWHGYIRDVTDRKRAERLVRESEERLSFALAAANIGDWDMDLRTNVARRSLRHDQCFGHTEPVAEWGYDTLLAHVQPIDRDRVDATYQAALAGEGDYDVEFRVAWPDGSLHWLWSKGRFYFDETGRPYRVAGIQVDISDRKAADDRFRVLDACIARLNDIVLITDAEPIDQPGPRIVFVNDAFVRRTGYTREEAIGRTPRILQGPKTSRAELDRVRAAMQQWKPVRAELINYTKSGEEFWLEMDIVPVPDARGWFTHWVAVERDVTERKRNEAALQESEDRLRLALEAGRLGTFDWDITTDRIVWSDTHYDLFGYPPGDRFSVEFRHFADRLHPDDRPAIERAIREAQETRTPYANESRIVLPDGTVRWMMGSGEFRYAPDGRAVRMLGTTIDITERKQAEDLLRASEQRLRLALTAGRMGIFDWDLATNAVVWSDTHYELFGYPAGERFPVEFRHFANRIHSDDLPAVERALRTAMETGVPYRNEARVLLPDGTIRWVMGVGEFQYDPAGRPVRMLGTASDITDRKQAEEALLASEARARAVINSSPVPIALNDHGQRITFLNLAFTRTFGYELADIPTLADWWPKAYPDPAYRQWVAEAWQAELTRSAQTGTAFAVMDITIRCKDGKDRFVEANAAPLADTSAGTHLVVLHDITERRKADAALQESEARLRIFVENAPAGVAMFDRDMKYISYSRRWLTDYGLGDQNLIGRSYYEVFPEVTDQWKEIHRRCLTGLSERCEQDRFERADGTVHYLRWEIQAWTHATGTVGGLVLLTEMITDRVRAEEQIRASLKEKEAMLKEIHHRVKNNLQVISSLLSLQAAQVTTHPVAADVLAESQNRVRAMALVHETLYRSDDLARVDLARYIQELYGYLFRSYGVDSARVGLVLDVESVTVSLEKTIPCGLLMNEIVSNSLKYAFPGNRSGTVSIKARMQSDGLLVLTLADDGVGLPNDVVIDNTPTLGLQLVNILTDQLGGQLTLERFGGTRYDLSFTP